MYGDRNYGSSRPANNGNSKPKDATHTVSEDYLKNGYYDSNGVIQQRYVLSLAKHIGNNLTEEVRAKKTGYNKIRVVLDAIKNPLLQLENGYISAYEARLELDKLVGRIYKRCSNGSVTRYFRDIITTNIEYIDKLNEPEEIKKAIKAFAVHYEAIVGFVEAK